MLFYLLFPPNLGNKSSSQLAEIIYTSIKNGIKKLLALIDALALAAPTYYVLRTHVPTSHCKL